MVFSYIGKILKYLFCHLLGNYLTLVFLLPSQASVPKEESFALNGVFCWIQYC